MNSLLLMSSTRKVTAFNSTPSAARALSATGGATQGRPVTNIREMLDRAIDRGQSWSQSGHAKVLTGLQGSVVLIDISMKLRFFTSFWAPGGYLTEWPG